MYNEVLGKVCAGQPLEQSSTWPSTDQTSQPLRAPAHGRGRWRVVCPPLPRRCCARLGAAAEGHRPCRQQSEGSLACLSCVRFVASTQKHDAFAAAAESPRSPVDRRAGSPVPPQALSWFCRDDGGHGFECSMALPYVASDSSSDLVCVSKEFAGRTSSRRMCKRKPTGPCGVGRSERTAGRKLSVITAEHSLVVRTVWVVLPSYLAWFHARIS